MKQKVLTKYKIYSVLRRAGVLRSQPAKGRMRRGEMRGWSQGYRLTSTRPYPQPDGSMQSVFLIVYVEAFPTPSTNSIPYNRDSCVQYMRQVLDTAGLDVRNNGKELVITGYRST